MVPTMRFLVARALVLSVAAVASLMSAPMALACSGVNGSLSDGVRNAESIYYARITGVTPTSGGFHSLRLDVGGVLDGPAPREVTRVIANQSCVGIEVGQVGIIVLGSVDPFRDGRDDAYNLFYAIGMGRTSRADAEAVLGLSPPPTDRAAAPIAERETPPLALFAVLPISVIVACWYMRRREVERRPARDRRAIAAANDQVRQATIPHAD